MSDNSSDDKKAGVSTGSNSSTETSSHSSSNWKVLGETPASDGIGVLGHATSGSGVTRGVKGVVDSNTENAAAVRGDATSDLGITRGVDGRSRGNPDGTGVLGLAVSDSYSFNPATGFPIGLWGVTDRSDADPGVVNAFGVLGNTEAPSGTTVGVDGNNFNSDSGIGVRGRDFTGNGYGVVSLGDSRVEGRLERTKVGVSVGLSSAQNISDATITQVQFDSVEFDDGGWDSNNNEYVAPVDGTYRVHTHISYDGTLPEGTFLQILLRQASLEVADHQESLPDTGGRVGYAQGFTRTVRASQGESISVDVYQASGNTQTLEADTNRNFVEVTQIG